MKRLIIVILALLLAGNCFADDICEDCSGDVLAWMSPMVAGGGVASGNACEDAGCTGTYDFCYTGDYSGDVRKACYANGSNQTGTDVGTISVSSGYITVDAVDEGLEFVVSSDDVMDSALGTIWLSFCLDTDAITASTQIFEAGDELGSDDYIYCYISTDDTATCSYKGDWATKSVTSVNTASSDSCSTWNRLMYTWDLSGDKHKVVLDGGTGEEATTAELTALTPEPTIILFGQEYSTIGMQYDIQIKDVHILPTYDASDPDA